MKAVYIPLIERELVDLEFLALAWRLCPPFLSNVKNDCDLIISFDAEVSEVCRSYVRDVLLPKFRSCGFDQVKIISANLSPEEAIYIRGSDDYDGEVPRLGLKSGPNLHFLFNQNYVKQCGYDLAFQCEADVVPLCSGWLEKIFSEAGDFLICGPVYRGPSRLGGRVLRHINGNALYNLSHILYEDYLRLLGRSLEYLIEKGLISTAFDTALFEFFHYVEVENKSTIYSDFSDVGLTSEDVVRQYVSKISYSSCILNFTGGVESKPGYAVDFHSVLADYGSGAVAVHSPHFRYYMLGKLVKSRVLDFKDKRFLVYYAKCRLFPRHSKADIYRKYVVPNEALKDALTKGFVSPLIWGS